MKAFAIAVVMVVGACKDKDKAKIDLPTAPTPGSAAVVAPGSAAPVDDKKAKCDNDAAELKGWITSVLDPAQKVAAPRPTGDAEFDANLDKWRASVRNTKPAEP